MKKNVKQSEMTANIGKLSIGLTVLTMLLFGLSVYINATAQQAAMMRFELAHNARRFLGGSKTLTDEVRSLAATGDKTHRELYEKELNVDKNREIGLAKMEEIGITDEEKALIKKMAELSNKLVPLEVEAMKQAATGNRRAAVDAVYGNDYNKTLDEITALSNQFLASLDKRSAEKIETMNTVRGIATLIVTIMVCALVFLQVYNVRYIREDIIQPILKIRDAMFEVAKGNLSSRVDLEADDSEIGDLVNTIQSSNRTMKTYVSDISAKLSEMANGNMNIDHKTKYIGDFKPIGESIKVINEYINMTISNLKAKTEDVANAVTERAQSVAAGSQEMASSAHEQSESVERVVVSVNGLTHDMDNIVNNAVDAERRAGHLTESLKSNTKQMQDMEIAMQNISKSSEGIKSIIDTISNIAKQTNLLALNASIEAARAGEAGKGFAVVAEEVRVLSEECRDASVKTNDLIEQSLTAVNRGVELTSLTFRAIEEMMVQVNETSEAIGSIATSSREKVGVLHEINDTFKQLAKVTKSSSNMAKDSAAAANELNEHAGMLSTMFEEFTLR